MSEATISCGTPLHGEKTGYDSISLRSAMHLTDEIEQREFTLSYADLDTSLSQASVAS